MSEGDLGEMCYTVLKVMNVYRVARFLWHTMYLMTRSIACNVLSATAELRVLFCCYRTVNKNRRRVRGDMIQVYKIMTCKDKINN